MASMRATLVLAALGLANGCGRLRFADLGDAAPLDAGCTFGPWSAPRPLTELSSTADDYGPWLSPDRLTALVSSNISGDFQILLAQRATVQSPFTAPTVIPLGPGAYGDPWLSPDGLTLWIDSSPATSILSATRASVSEAFATPIVETELALGKPEVNPGLSLDQLTIAFDTLTTPQHIYIATRTSVADAFSAPQSPPSLDVATQQCCVSFSGDGTFMLLGSDLATPGVKHIVQVADNGDGTFGAPIEFAPTLVGNDGTDDTDPYITPGGDAVIFASQRAPGLGSHDIFEVDRECL